jgi:hypothetical protein
MRRTVMQVASCMKDYDSQEELSDSEDPDLLSELQELDEDEPDPFPQVRLN